MKHQLLIISLLKYLVITNQEDGQTLGPTGGLNYEDIYTSLNISEGNVHDEESSPCHTGAPGFKGVGLVITYFIVFVFSIVGNSVVVYVVCYMKNGRASTDIYLMHLALADLLFSVTLPFWAIYGQYGWIFGNFLCKLLSGFQEASVYSGVFLLVCISVDRHFAIVRATRVLSSRHKLVKAACSVVWLAAGLLSLPVVIQRESIHATEWNQYICHENLTGESVHQWRVGVRILRHTIGFFLPLLVMAVCYGWTLVTLFHTRNQHKHKAMRVILAVVLAFVLCWLPYNITMLNDTLIRGGSLEEGTCDNLYRREAVLSVTQLLAFLHCAVNPVLYGFIGQKFRNQLLSALYKHGLISSRLQMAYRKGSASSVGSSRYGHSSVTM